MAPSSMAYRRSSPIGIILAQPAQVIRAAVASNAKTSRSRPPAALPSSVEHISSRLISPSSCRSEALGLDAPGLVPEPNQRLGHRLHHRRRAADEYLGRRRGWESDLGQHRRVDPPGVTAPAWWRPLARKRVNDPGPAGRRPEPLQLLAVDDVREGARGEQEARRHGAARRAARRAVAQHGHQRPTPEPPATSSSGPPAATDQAK